ncbi:unnamed protein product [Mytilus edulis]|uniref:Uncharacterized protein n=1 Tax=Mytilus edulis TaxID=6550 RepID=A0A8S3QCM6_MYTED|nr:unnamed protein product [Mytilus edulis]
MENSNSMAVVKELNTGTERKDLTVLKVDSMCNWEQFLMPAPTSIAILGQLMAIATKKDFSLDKTIPEGGFKFVKYPGSFRACLVQISNSGCEAFMEAHKKASAAVKGVYEDGLKEALEKMKLLQMEEKKIETRKHEMEDEKKRIIEDLGKAKSALEKALTKFLE